MKNILLTITFAICFAAPAFGQITAIPPSTPEQSGDEYAAAGKYADAISQYKTAWLGWMTGRNDNDADLLTARERLAGKMAAALAKMASPPAVNDETELHALKGAAFIKNAASQADFEKAVKEFQDAVNAAPWVFDYQFNLAVALKSAKQFKAALGYAKIAKLLAQNDKDRHDALGLRAEIEAAGEMAAAANAEAVKQAEVKAKEQRISGDWRRPQKLNDGVPRLEILHLTQDTSGKWKLSFDFSIGNDTNKNLSYGEKDLLVAGDEMRFKIVEGMYGETCATYDVRGTVSGDGSTLNLAYDLMPFSSDYSSYKYCLKSNYGSHVRRFKR